MLSRNFSTAPVQSPASTRAAPRLEQLHRRDLILRSARPAALCTRARRRWQKESGWRRARGRSWTGRGSERVEHIRGDGLLGARSVGGARWRGLGAWRVVRGGRGGAAWTAAVAEVVGCADGVAGTAAGTGCVTDVAATCAVGAAAGDVTGGADGVGGADATLGIATGTSGSRPACAASGAGGAEVTATFRVGAAAGSGASMRNAASPPTSRSAPAMPAMKPLAPLHRRRHFERVGGDRRPLRDRRAHRGLRHRQRRRVAHRRGIAGDEIARPDGPRGAARESASESSVRSALEATRRLIAQRWHTPDRWPRGPTGGRTARAPRRAPRRWRSASPGPSRGTRSTTSQSAIGRSGFTLRSETGGCIRTIA